ncbi:MAG TPA: exodeoxyribonuclease VII small subunit [Candidatus Fournierella merdigallinarum]|nr:exodeoxyribonuclease VII small subunit [Candidatus Fournierella merdigallinarum]
MKRPKSFEEGIERLQGLLDKLSDQDTPLEEAIRLYTEAAALAEFCTDALQNARLEMETIDARLAQLDKPQEEGGTQWT